MARIARGRFIFTPGYRSRPPGVTDTNPAGGRVFSSSRMNRFQLQRIADKLNELHDNAADIGALTPTFEEAKALAAEFAEEESR